MGTSAVCLSAQSGGQLCSGRRLRGGNGQSWKTRCATRPGHGIGPRRITRRTPVFLPCLSLKSEIRGQDKEQGAKYYLPTAPSAHVMGALDGGGARGSGVTLDESLSFALCALHGPVVGKVGKAAALTTGLVACSGNSSLGLKEAGDRAGNPCCKSAFRRSLTPGWRRSPHWQ